MILGVSKSTSFNQTNPNKRDEKTMSINFKNSIFTKLHPSNINDTSNMIENSNFISNPNLVFSERSESLEISKLKKKDMSHLSRRDLSRMDDTSELNSGGE
jgi:hypothetical protein